MKTIYVGMGLTQAPEEFRETFQYELKTALRTIPHAEVLDFVGLEDGTDVEVYEHDRVSAETADLCVFVVDHPSIGLGIEIALRLTKGVPMVVFAAEGVRITRMLTGLCAKHGVPFVRYQSVADIHDEVVAQLSQ